MLSNIHKATCFLWRQNNPDVNYSTTVISGGGDVSRGSIAQQTKEKHRRRWEEPRRRWEEPRCRWKIILRGIFRKWEGVVGTGWSGLRIGTGGGRL
jgi:hypothetical protein